jgi:hypothetical protein
LDDHEPTFVGLRKRGFWIPFLPIFVRPDAEVVVVINEPEQLNFLSTMLERDPQEKELKYWTKWLQGARSNADALRSNLMTRAEFIKKYGYVNPLNLHAWRNDRWLELILKTCSEFQKEGTDWPDARDGIRCCLER